MDLREILRVIRSRAGVIAAVVILAVAATGLSTHFLMEPKYEASTKLIVNKSSVQDNGYGITWDDVTVNVQLIATYKELIRTEAIMNEVLSKHPDIGLSGRELMETVTVSSVNGTQVMTVVAQDESYERAALIVNAVSEVFKSKVVEIMKVDNVTILNNAAADEKPAPISPNLAMNVAISLVLSLMFSLGIVFLLHHLNDTIMSEEEIMSELNLPILATIKQIDKKDLYRHRAGKPSRKAAESVYVTANQ
ncbi:YveK family protein [Cohnella sp.]|uniref:YveK family protein n=1 Tax=Cohnella sp. TaxID=1883426 RepID=UPI00356AFC52